MDQAGERFEEHPLVRRGATAESAGVNRVLLRGFLSKGKTDGTARLYLDGGLSSYLEFDSAAILSAKNPEIDALHEPSEVWVRPDTVLKLVDTSPGSMQAEYLEGDIIQRDTPLMVQHPTARLFSGVRQATLGGATCGSWCVSV